MIKINNVSKQIKNRNILTNISLDINQNEMVIIQGHNGSGKTMLLRLIAGFIQPSTGTVSNDFSSIGVIIEKPEFLNISGLENLKYLANINNLIKEEDILSCLKDLDLYNDRNLNVRKYSLGMKQKLAIIQSYMENQELLLLDEPFIALDKSSISTVVNLLNNLKEKGKTIVIAPHDNHRRSQLNHTKMIEMENGEIV